VPRNDLGQPVGEVVPGWRARPALSDFTGAAGDVMHFDDGNSRGFDRNNPNPAEFVNPEYLAPAAPATPAGSRPSAPRIRPTARARVTAAAASGTTTTA
jgi:hypothetical protein